MNYYTATVLFTLIHWSLSAMVLPRPPSSSNYVQHYDRKASDRKLYAGKSLGGFLPNSNVERTNTHGYSVVEIELQSPDELDATSLQNIVHTMMKQSGEVHNSSYPNPEVIPHSIFGVRDVGFSPNFKVNVASEDRHILVGASKYKNSDEKLYYLKSSRPKVYVNVRGRSGSFRKEFPKTTSNHDVEFLQVTPPLQRRLKLAHGKKTRPFKKFEAHGYPKHLLKNDTNKYNKLAIVYDWEDLSTTESSMVTSSELPKQIPAPPSKFPSRTLMAQTTPVQRYPLRRTNILPEYSFPDI